LGAYNNYVIGGRTPPLASNSGVRDANPPGKNFIVLYETTIGGVAIRGKVNVWNELSDATGADFSAYKGTNYVNIVNHKHTITGTNGGQWDLQTKVDGGAVTTRQTIKNNGDVVFTNQTNGTLFGGKTAFDTTTAGWTIEHGVGRSDVVNSGTGSSVCVGFYNGNGQVGNITTNGSATAFNTSSDRRLKTNIIDVAPQGNVIDAIRIVEHEFKKEPGVKYIGVIADELQKVYPQAVSGSPDAMRKRVLEHDYIEEHTEETEEDAVSHIVDHMGDPIRVKTKHCKVVAEHKTRTEEVEEIAPQGVDYTKLVPLLIAEVQSLRKRVAELESK